MINEYKNVYKLNEIIQINNVISYINNTKKEKIYSKKQITSVEKLINSNDIHLLIDFILKNDLNLNSIMPFNYRDLKLYSTNKLLDIKELNDYKIFEEELNNLIKQKDFLLDFLNNSYKNSSKRKGSLFSKIINYILKNKIVDKKICNDIEIIFKFEELKDKENFIYIPEKDDLIKKYFENINKKVNFSKGRDILIKHNKIFYIGEVKSIGEAGGSQNNQFNDILTCIKEFNQEDVKGFGVIYGPCLLTENPYIKEINNNKNIIPISEFLFNFENIIEQL